MSGLTPEEREALFVALLDSSDQFSHEAVVERIVADRERAAEVRALREYADEIEWKRPEVSPCAPNFEQCCGSEASCDAMRPVTKVVGAKSLRDRADRVEGGGQ